MATAPEYQEFREGNVRGYLHRPRARADTALVITHGAGGNCAMPLLVAAARAFAAEGFSVLRCDLPFRQKRPHGGPMRGDAARDRAGLKEAVAAMRALTPGRVFLGGQSYGGRQASMLAAEDPSVAEALLLFSYPLHLPGKPKQLRTEHFPSLRTPALFIHGTSDPFATTAELRTALALIPARTSLIEVESAGHDLARGHFDIQGLVVGPFEQLCA